MPSAIQTEIGLHPFTEKSINAKTADQIISEMLKTLGIKAKPEVKETDNTDFLTVNGYVCRFPANMFAEIEAYAGYYGLEKGIKTTDELVWKLFISNILWLQPHVLFPAKLMIEYLPDINTYPAEKQKEIQKEFKQIINELLDLKLSLADSKRIIEISQKYFNAPSIEWNHLREELIESLSATEIGIYLNPVYFEEIITAPSKQNLFEMMRHGMFYETGMKYPHFNIHLDDTLPIHAFYFKINSFTTIPIQGIGGNQILVNDTPDRLKLIGISGTPTLNPANGNQSSFIASQDKAKAENNGLTTWDNLGYFILAFSGILRKHGYVFVNTTLTTQYIEQLRSTFPKLIELFANEKKLPLGVQTLRLLAREGISIRNFRVIMEAILESDYVVADALKYIVFDERIPLPAKANSGWETNTELVAEFVRTRLKRYISHKYTKGQSTLMVYLLDPEIEKIFDSQSDPLQTLESESISNIHRAVDVEMENLPVSSQQPVILTTVNVRPYLKRIIEAKYPQVAVLSYQELSPDMNIQPIARISL